MKVKMNKINSQSQSFHKIQSKKESRLKNQVIIDFNPSIKLKNFKMKYREELPLVLKGIDLEIEAGEKVGIIGRTGAGKSSIIQSLLRICEPEEGSVYELGEFNALELGLHTLRKNISVIPQVPFLFRDTIKKNIDPLESYSEEEVWKVLRESDLQTFVEEVIVLLVSCRRNWTLKSPTTLTPFQLGRSNCCVWRGRC